MSKIHRSRHKAQSDNLSLKKGQISTTSIPFFDIDFKTFMTITGNDVQDEPTLAQINENIDAIKLCFGIHNLGYSIKDLTN